MRIGNVEMTEVRPNFWVPQGTEIRTVGTYIEYWLAGQLIMAEPSPQPLAPNP